MKLFPIAFRSFPSCLSAEVDDVAFVPVLLTFSKATIRELERTPARWRLDGGPCRTFPAVGQSSVPLEILNVEDSSVLTVVSLSGAILVLELAVSLKDDPPAGNGEVSSQLGGRNGVSKISISIASAASSPFSSLGFSSFSTPFSVLISSSPKVAASLPFLLTMSKLLPLLFSLLLFSIVG